MCSTDNEFSKCINLFYYNLLIRDYTVKFLDSLFFSNQFESIKIARNSLILKRLHKSNKPTTNPLTLITTHDNISHLLLNKHTLTPSNDILQFDHANIFSKPIRIAKRNLPNLSRLLIKNN